MAKFHVNSEGTPGPCKAGNGETAGGRGCPFGDATQHYDTPKEARAAYEKEMEDKAVPEASGRKPAEPEVDPEVVEARKLMLGYGDDSFMEERNGAAMISKRVGIKEEVAQKVIDQLKQEEEAEQAARFAKTQVVARDIASKTNPDVSKVRKGATVAVTDGDALMTVKVTSHRGGKISGYASNGDYVDGWPDDVILTSESKLD